MAGAGNVRTVTRDFEHWVRTVEPSREHEMRKVLEYEFGSGVHRRLFYGDPNKRGAYGGPRPIPVLGVELQWVPDLTMMWGGQIATWYDPTIRPEPDEEFLLENNSKLLLEDGGNLLLETQ